MYVLFMYRANICGIRYTFRPCCQVRTGEFGYSCAVVARCVLRL